MPRKKSVAAVPKVKSAKKSTKKASTKPVSASKKKTAATVLTARVPDERVFFVIDGSTIASMQELVNALDSMNDDIYYYHVTSDRNDFANWVREVLKMEDLADKLTHAQGALRAETIILKHLLEW